MKKIITIIVLTLVFTNIFAETALEWDKKNIKVYNTSPRTSKSKSDGPGAVIFELKTKTPWPYFKIFPAKGKSWDLSKYKYISFDIENLNPKAQCEVAFYIEKSILGLIANRPGEKRTAKFKLNHRGKQTFEPLFKAKRMLDGFKGGINVDTTNVKFIRILSSYPLYSKYRISNIKLSGEYHQNPASLKAEKFFPFIDKYGQYVHEDWTEKIKKNHDIQKVFQKEKSLLKPRVKSWNKWGGWKNGPQLKATGFFRTEKYKGKWYIVDPNGKLFFSRGINAVDIRDWTGGRGKEKIFTLTSKRSDRGFMFYKDNLRIKYGKNWQKDFYKFLSKRMDSWGFNTVGNWSNDELCKMRKHPYVLNLPLPKTPLIKGLKRLRDVYSEKFTEGMKDAFGKKYKWVINDPWCLGIFIGNEIRFGNSTKIAEATFESESSQAAKQEFIKDLKNKYKKVTALNNVWGSNYTNWDEVLNSKTLPDKKKSKQDFEQFSAKFVKDFFKISRDAIKRHSPNTLYLGSRLFCGDDYFRPYLNKAATEYFDIISYNLYQLSFDRYMPRGMPKNKPVIITESTVGTVSRGRFGSLTNTGKITNAREEGLKRQIESALRHPQIVGIHHFAFKDQALIGRWDGENYNFGLVDITDTPYQKFVEANRMMAEKFYEFRIKSKAVTFTK